VCTAIALCLTRCVVYENHTYQIYGDSKTFYRRDNRSVLIRLTNFIGKCLFSKVPSQGPSFHYWYNILCKIIRSTHTYLYVWSASEIPSFYITLKHSQVSTLLLAPTETSSHIPTIYFCDPFWYCTMFGHCGAPICKLVRLQKTPFSFLHFVYLRLH
jgi:hypothetical protein